MQSDPPNVLGSAGMHAGRPNNSKTPGPAWPGPSKGDVTVNIQGAGGLLFYVPFTLLLLLLPGPLKPTAMSGFRALPRHTFSTSISRVKQIHDQENSNFLLPTQSCGKEEKPIKA